MRRDARSFVVQLDPPTVGSAPGSLTGRVENLASGEWTQFRSARVLVRFLREALEGDASLHTSGRNES